MAENDDDVLEVVLPNGPDITPDDKNTSQWYWTAAPKPISLGSNTPSDQWLRRMELTVYSAAGTSGPTSSGLKLSALRINFQVKKATSQTPNTLFARVYNLSPATMNRIKAFTRVALSAGYWGTSGDPDFYLRNTSLGGGNYGMIFDGTVVMYVQGKENAVDTYLEIHAGDGDRPMNTGVINMTFPAGTAITEQVKRIADDAWKTEIGKLEIKDDKKSVRATTLIGMAHERMREIAYGVGNHFWIDDGRLYMIPYTGYSVETTIELSPTTGLVGMPMVTPEGIQAQCLLNPKLRIGGKVHIATGLLSGLHWLPGSTDLTQPWNSGGNPRGVSFTPTGGANKFFNAAATSPTGTYKILMMEHHGDNRGPPWYTNLTCMAVEGNLPAPSAFNRSAAAMYASGIKGAETKNPAEPSR